ncbi:hypothetical protein GCM10020255_059260 [Rhodococcus baikonurensis]
MAEPQLPDSELVVARTWHPLRWVISAVVLVLLAQFIHGLVVNPGWDWPTFAQYFTAKSVLAALWVTIKLTLWGRSSDSVSVFSWRSAVCRRTRSCR